MAIVKSIVHKGGRADHLQEYLFKDTTDVLAEYLDGDERHTRALAVDCSYTVEDPTRWAEEFAELRRFHEVDAKRRLYHFVVSPDPGEEVGLDGMRALARFWAEQNFGKEGQWVAVYHDDNEHRVLHAHVVLNAVRADGRMWHFGSRDWAELANRAHRLSRELGIGCELRDVGRQHSHDVRRESAPVERKARESARRGRSWVEDIRRAVDRTAPHCHDADELKDLLKREWGVTVRENRRGGWTFAHPWAEEGSHRFSVKDSRLGLDYTPAGVASKYLFDARAVLESGDGSPIAHIVREKARLAALERRVGMRRVRPKPYVERLKEKCSLYGRGRHAAVEAAVEIFEEMGLREAAEIEARLSELDARAAELDGRYERLFAVSDTAYLAYEKTRIWSDTKQAADTLLGKRGRARERYLDAHRADIESHGEADAWLREHNLRPGGEGTPSYEELRSLWGRAQDATNEALLELTRATDELEHLRGAVEGVRSSLARSRSRARRGVISPEDVLPDEHIGNYAIFRRGRGRERASHPRPVMARVFRHTGTGAYRVSVYVAAERLAGTGRDFAEARERRRRREMEYQGYYARRALERERAEVSVPGGGGGRTVAAAAARARAQAQARNSGRAAASARKSSPRAAARQQG